VATDKRMRAIVPTKVEDALRTSAGALQEAGVEFALVGGLALDHYADEPRFTRDVDFVVSADRWRDAVRAIKGVGFKRGRVDSMLTQLENRDDVRVDLLFGVGDPEESAHATAKIRKVLDATVPVVSPETLVWTYLISDQRRHEEDAERLVRWRIDLAKLAGWLKQTKSVEELAKLARVVARVRGG